MYTDGALYLGLAGETRVTMPLNMCNRHGLIAGASGTGKRSEERRVGKECAA